jgi:hypothetical protein
MSAVTFVALIAWGLAAWLAIFLVVPSCMQSMFRHRLWRLRDNVVDQIRGERLVDAEPFRKLVREIECAILAAREVSPFRITLLRFASRDLLRDAKFDYFDPADVDVSDRVLAEGYLNELRAAFYRQMLFGSPSGWLLLIVLSVLTFPVAVAVVLLRLIRGIHLPSTDLSRSRRVGAEGGGTQKRPEIIVAEFRSHRAEVLAEVKIRMRKELSAEADPERAVLLLRGRHDRDNLSVCV